MPNFKIKKHEDIPVNSGIVEETVPENLYQENKEKIVCPNCNSTEVYFNTEEQVFICKFCRSKFNTETDETDILINDIEDIKNLEKDEISKGMSDINTDDNKEISFQCPSCKATITIERQDQVGSIQCHWCKHILNIDNKVNNGIRPDGLIPFKITKEEAAGKIKSAMQKKKFFADPVFIKQFNINEIKPVYLPYVCADFKIKSHHSGKAGITKRTYTSNKKTYYDYDLYEFSRDFDLYINDLLVEANSNYIYSKSEEYMKNSKNIVNSILPFNTKDIVDYNPQFLNGDYRAEFRDLNQEEIQKTINNQIQDVSVFKCTETMKQYTHGADFKENKVDIINKKYISILGPVWLYSYKDKKGRLNYICVNGQTGETATCIPINKTKLFVISSIIECVAVALFLALIIL